MNDDLERRLQELIRGGPDPALRGRVLAAVGDELAREPSAPRRSSRLRFRPGVAAAGLLLLGLVLNYAANVDVDRRLERVLGPKPVPRRAAELAADIAAVSDGPTGRWALERLISSPPAPTPLSYTDRMRQLLSELKEIAHETPEADPQVGRGLRGCLDRSPADGERLLRLEHRNRA